MAGFILTNFPLDESWPRDVGPPRHWLPCRSLMGEIEALTLTLGRLSLGPLVTMKLCHGLARTALRSCASEWPGERRDQTCQASLSLLSPGDDEQERRSRRWAESTVYATLPPNCWLLVVKPPQPPHWGRRFLKRRKSPLDHEEYDEILGCKTALTLARLNEEWMKIQGHRSHCMRMWF